MAQRMGLVMLQPPLPIHSWHFCSLAQDQPLPMGSPPHLAPTLAPHSVTLLGAFLGPLDAEVNCPEAFTMEFGLRMPWLASCEN